MRKITFTTSITFETEGIATDAQETIDMAKKMQEILDACDTHGNPQLTMLNTKPLARMSNKDYCFYETIAILSMDLARDHAAYDQLYESIGQGIFGVTECIFQWAKKFVYEINARREWDGEYLEEVQLFLISKLKEEYSIEFPSKVN